MCEENTPSMALDKINWKTASGIVLANMIGTGVFTSLGYQLLDIQGTWTIILLWVIGGVLGLIGAFSFAELGTHFQRSGGEYVYLSRIFHPIMGYMSAWASLTVGFPAPVALAAIAMTEYLSPFGLGGAKWLAVTVVICISLLHSFSLRQSKNLQDFSTLIKMAFILGLVTIGIFTLSNVESALDFSPRLLSKEIWLPGFSVSLIYVTYAYTGWNSAAYVVGEINNPRKSLPIALISSVFLVTILYILVQLVFLKHASRDQLSGEVDVASIAFQNIFGPTGAKWVSFFIAIQLIATISGYTWVGSRVTQEMAKDYSLWAPLSKTNRNGIPVRAIWLHTAICIFFTLSGTFEQVLVYAGFTLQLMSTLAVSSLIFLKRKAGTYHSPLKPTLQILYVVFNIGVLGYVIITRPLESLVGIGIILLGGCTYFLKSNKNTFTLTNILDDV